MNNFDKVKKTTQLFQDLKLLDTPFHQEELKTKYLYDEWVKLMEECRSIIFQAGNGKIYQREFEVPLVSEFLDDYILKEKFFIQTENSYL